MSKVYISDIYHNSDTLILKELEIIITLPYILMRLMIKQIPETDNYCSRLQFNSNSLIPVLHAQFAWHPT